MCVPLLKKHLAGEIIKQCIYIYSPTLTTLNDTILNLKGAGLYHLASSGLRHFIKVHNIGIGRTKTFAQTDYPEPMSFSCIVLFELYNNISDSSGN